VKPGDKVFYRHTHRGGYGFEVSYPAVVVKVNAKTVRIRLGRAETVSGPIVAVERSVSPDKLTSREEVVEFEDVLVDRRHRMEELTNDQQAMYERLLNEHAEEECARNQLELDTWLGPFGGSIEKWWSSLSDDERRHWRYMYEDYEYGPRGDGAIRDDVKHHKVMVFLASSDARVIDAYSADDITDDADGHRLSV